MNRGPSWTTSTTRSEQPGTNHLITEKERNDLMAQGCCLCGTPGFLYCCPACGEDALIESIEAIADIRAQREYEASMTEGHDKP